MTDYQRIEKVIRYLELNYKDQPSLKELAKVVGLSEFHFQKLFTRWAGVTPKTFVQFLTAHHAKELLRESKDILSASMDSGLSGPGRLHDLMISMEAMTPGEFKKKGENLIIRYGIHDSPFGKCLIGITDRGICYLAFIENRKLAVQEMQERWPAAKFTSSVSETKKVLKGIFKKTGKKKYSLLLQGTEFQVKVWEALLTVPEGAVISYDHLANLAGFPKAARAVGSAVGQNAIAYLIPCHRVIRETGVFGHYRWGATRKRSILSWEQLRKT